MNGIKAYSGSGKYIFISYAHADEDQVFPIIEYLQKNGYNVWFDEGITPGVEWPDFIAHQIEGCSCFLGFLSPESVRSNECKGEIYHASNENKDIVSILLKKTDLPSGLRMKLSMMQAIEKYNYENEGQFYIKLLEHDQISECKDTEEFQILGDRLIRYNGKLHNVTVPESITQIGYNAFENCNELRNVTLTRNIDRLGKFAFYRCRNLVRFDVDAENGFLASVEGVLYNKAMNILMRYPCQRPDAVYAVPSSVKNIGLLSFSDAAHLQRIDMGDNVIEIGERAFESCRELLTVKLSNRIRVLKSYLFSRCSSLVTIQIPNSVEELYNSVFSGCISLQSIRLPAKLKKIGEMCFAYCDSLKEISIPQGVRNIPDYCFYECNGLEQLNLGNVEEIYPYAFKNCESLKRLEIPDTVKRIGRAAFSGCCALEELIIPGNVEYIGEYTFDRCTMLKRLIIKDGVKTIAEGAFADDKNLQIINLPDSLESVHKTVFRGCDLLSIPENIYSLDPS